MQNQTEPCTCSISAKVPPSTHKALQKYAKEWGMTQSDVIRTAVESYIWGR